MPISTSNFGDARDDRYDEYQANQYEVETLAFPGVTVANAELWLKRLGGGMEEHGQFIEGIGWKAEIVPFAPEGGASGVSVTFHAHDELLDDLVRRFEEWVNRSA